MSESEHPPPAQRAAEVFGRIYRAQAWETGSGIGSTADATGPYREVLSLLLGSCDVRSVVDVGCGDWQLGSLVDWSNVTYLGVDVVADLVETNTRAHAASNVSFRVADATTDRLPAADLLLAKDVLQHWPISAITRFLSANVGRYRYQLLTNDVASTRWAGGTNEETGLGGWRTLDLEAPPFDRRAAWRADYDVHGEWTKRLVLYASRPARLAASWRRCTALSRLRAALPMDGARPLG